jgi:Plasmid stabilization system protein
MKIVFKDSFVNRLADQIDFIAKDSPSRARKFKSELLERIKDIPSNPIMFRKSIYFNDDNIRDLIYKGYTVIFRISGDTIEIFGFVKHQHSPY